MIRPGCDKNGSAENCPCLPPDWASIGKKWVLDMSCDHGLKQISKLEWIPEEGCHNNWFHGLDYIAQQTSGQYKPHEVKTASGNWSKAPPPSSYSHPFPSILSNPCKGLMACIAPPDQSQPVPWSPSSPINTDWSRGRALFLVCAPCRLILTDPRPMWAMAAIAHC